MSITKKTIITIILSVFSFSIVAQIPNFSFETWNNMGSYENPDQWGTLNNITSPSATFTCEKGTPGNPGSSFIILFTKNIPGFGVVPGMAVTGTIDTSDYSAQGGFPFTQRPLSLTGNWQYMPWGSTDFGFISVYLTKWNTTTNTRDTVSKTVSTLVGMAMTWSPFNILLSYQMGIFPDTAQIVLSASGKITPAHGDFLYVDNLSFAGTAAGVESNGNLANSITVLPNPSNGVFTIQSEEKINLIEIYNTLGVNVYKKDAYISLSTTIDLSTQTKGVYFIKITTKNKTVIKKIVKQ